MPGSELAFPRNLSCRDSGSRCDPFQNHSLRNYYNASDVAELEPTFRQVPITGQHMSSHPPAAKLQHFRMILTVQDSGYRIEAGTSVALTALYIMKICKECPMRELLDLALQAHGGRSRRMEAEASNGGMNMSRYISKSVSLLTLTVVICGGLYALSLWVIGQAIFPFQANSSMLTGLDNKVVGAHQIAQPFTKDEYRDLGVAETPLLQRPAQRVCRFYDC